MTDRLCSGCSELFKISRKCASHLTSTLKASEDEVLICPCVDCLIKTICSSACTKFDIYAESYIDAHIIVVT